MPSWTLSTKRRPAASDGALLTWECCSISPHQACPCLQSPILAELGPPHCPRAVDSKPRAGPGTPPAGIPCTASDFAALHSTDPCRIVRFFGAFLTDHRRSGSEFRQDASQRDMQCHRLGAHWQMRTHPVFSLTQGTAITPPVSASGASSGMRPTIRLTRSSASSTQHDPNWAVSVILRIRQLVKHENLKMGPRAPRFVPWQRRHARPGGAAGGWHRPGSVMAPGLGGLFMSAFQFGSSNGAFCGRPRGLAASARASLP